MIQSYIDFLDIYESTVGNIKYDLLVDYVLILVSQAYQEESLISLQVSLNLSKTIKSLEKSQKKACNGIWHTIFKAKELYENKYPIYKC